MGWIELMGVSGVGKSYMYDKLCESKGSKYKWISEQEALRLTFFEQLHKRNISNTSILKYLIYRIFHKNNNIYKLLSGNYKRQLCKMYTNEINFLSELLIKGVISENVEFKNAVKMISFYFEKRLMPFLATKSILEDKWVLFGDGIMHNNIGIVQLDKSEARREKLNYTLFPDLIICLEADHDLIFKRVKQRNKESKNGGTFIQRGLSDKELFEQINTSAKRNEKKILNLEKYGSKVLRINANEDIEMNIDKINSHIHTLM